MQKFMNNTRHIWKIKIQSPENISKAFYFEIDL